jgi:chromosome partitioning protein
MRSRSAGMSRSSRARAPRAQRRRPSTWPPPWQRRPALLIDGEPERGTGQPAGSCHLRRPTTRESSPGAISTSWSMPTPGRGHRTPGRWSERCDRLIVPSTPDGRSLEAVSGPVATFNERGMKASRVLLTLVTPKPSRDDDDARATLKELGIPDHRERPFRSKVNTGSDRS